MISESSKFEPSLPSGSFDPTYSIIQFRLKA